MKLLNDRNALIEAVERLSNRGSFAVTIGKLALIADKSNLERLINAFPEYFKGQAYIRLVYDGRNDNLSKGQAGRNC
jgi:hypothetical protein